MDHSGWEAKCDKKNIFGLQRLNNTLSYKEKYVSEQELILWLCQQFLKRLQGKEALEKRDGRASQLTDI